MNTSETYNGWSNWQTWNCKLWLEEIPGLVDCAVNEIRDETSDDEDRVSRLADRLRNSFEYFAAEQVPTGFFADVVNHAIHYVNWREIAECYFVD